MTEIAHPIEINLREKLTSPEYRRKFFLAEASARIAKQIIALRKRRNLNQKQLAELAGTQQPAISRVERADYQNWSFNTLRSIADALDARIQVIITPSEDVLSDYDRPSSSPVTGPLTESPRLDFISALVNQRLTALGALSETPPTIDPFLKPYEALRDQYQNLGETNGTEGHRLQSGRLSDVRLSTARPVVPAQSWL